MLLTIPPATPPFSLSDAADAAFRQAASTQDRLWSFYAEHVLGTRLELLVHSHSGALARLAADAVRSEIERLNVVFNYRRSDSELAKLNAVRRAHASADLFAVLQLSEVWRHISQGAFDGRMGELLRLWGAQVQPDRVAVEQALAALHDATVTLDPIKRGIDLSSSVALSLDAVAKGYIVDAALNAACRAAPAILGLAINVGGDIRCWGKSPDPRGWRIGIQDAAIDAENAPLVDAVSLSNAAIATSGRGPRDLIQDRNGHGYRSTTISPFTGCPVFDVISASVVASHAADADAIATACMVLHPKDSIALVNKLDGVAARITDAQGQVHQSARWQTIQLVAAPKALTKQLRNPLPSTTLQSTAKQSTATQSKAARNDPDKSADSSSPNKQSLPPELHWPADWEIGITYTEPDRKDERSADFRIPYIAVWITDEQNKPINTLFMLGRDAKWQRDNFIWWGSHGARAQQLVELRSQSTTLSGRYRLFWSGLDDDWKPLPIGKYILHLETSQEHGKHSYRSVTLEVGRTRFKMSLPNETGSGGLEITYGHYNDRFNAEQ